MTGPDPGTRFANLAPPARLGGTASRNRPVVSSQTPRRSRTPVPAAVRPPLHPGGWSPRPRAAQGPLPQVLRHLRAGHSPRGALGQGAHPQRLHRAAGRWRRLSRFRAEVMEVASPPGRSGPAERGVGGWGGASARERHRRRLPGSRRAGRSSSAGRAAPARPLEGGSDPHAASQTPGPGELPSRGPEGEQGVRGAGGIPLVHVTRRASAASGPGFAAGSHEFHFLARFKPRR